MAMEEPALTEKVAEVAPAATVTEAGTVRAALSSERETALPPVGAALVRVTVQVLEAPAARLVGVQAREERAVEATREREAVRDTPPKEAVMVAA